MCNQNSNALRVLDIPHKGGRKLQKFTTSASGGIRPRARAPHCSHWGAGAGGAEAGPPAASLRRALGLRSLVVPLLSRDLPPSECARRGGAGAACVGSRPRPLPECAEPYRARPPHPPAEPVLEKRKRGGRAFGINSILYQRGIYPSETFTRVQKYGLTLLVTTDPELIKYLNNVVEQLKDWLYKCSVQKLVVVISNIESGEVLERWQFDIECDKTAKDDSAPREKSQKAIQDEIRSVIRQITATVTFLPLLEVACSFDLLIYTDKDLVVPEKWEESGPQFITNSEEVRLRSFTTTIHKVNSMVAYKIPVND
ncbi:mitotic spindle assembly checkpoint protein MAD2A [Octodon degus]|uniref:Mitotic spindle assembly checkpoint protein MAD2A n=1 Tax=Octodon degus TaxID=10160 RepID=A0A6P3FSB6_OCTDE|nr:mitotic spindle assembly checkpoint protein MAD2A [Octodon degus]